MESATCCLVVFKPGHPTLTDVRRAIVYAVLVSMSASRPVPLLLTNLGRGGFALDVQQSQTGELSPAFSGSQNCFVFFQVFRLSCSLVLMTVLQLLSSICQF